MKRLAFCLSLFAFLAAAKPAKAQIEFDHVRLHRRMFDLNVLPVYVHPGTTVGHLSSTDPASRIENGQRIDWFSNKDSGHFLRQDPEGHVLADIPGPGMITHLWCANPQGILKIFINRQAQPTFTADFKRFFHGQYDPITRPFATYRARGANLYLPLAFQRHCRIVVENPGDMIYQVDYTKFPEDTKIIESWSFARTRKPFGDSIRWYAQRLIDDPLKVKGQPIGSEPITIGPGESRNSSLKVGPASLQSFYVELSAPDLVKALREILLTINFDEFEQPQVWAPFGDFFGSGPGLNSYITVPIGVDGNKFYSKFRMPYKHSCEINFLNEGSQNVTIKVMTTVVGKRAMGENVGYFHAKWRRTYPNTNPEWVLADIKGRGTYIGTMLSVWNPKEEWWGEGDHRIYIDGAPIPVVHGTATEDYFGAAFADPTLFEHPYLVQSLAEGPNHSGYTSFLRWHILDRIPFETSFKFTFENYGTDKEYAAMAYWYSGEGSTDDFVPVPVEDRIPRPLRAGLVLADAFEAEANILLLRSNPPQITTIKQEMRDFDGQWSLNKQLLWRAAGPGQWIELGGVVAQPGEYELILHATKGPDYGTIRLSMGDRKLGKPFDAYADKITPSGPIPLGDIQITGLPDPIKVEVVGKNEKSSGFAVGLDAFRLVRKQVTPTSKPK